MSNFEPDCYFDRCSLCGSKQWFVRSSRSIRESYRCDTCKASLREREQGDCILSCFRISGASSLSDLVSGDCLDTLSVYEPGTSGALRKYLSKLTNYTQSDFYSETNLISDDYLLRNENLEKLTFNDKAFDLIVTSDIFEHIRSPDLAFLEIYRVLKPGGFHVFTVPLQDPLPTKTINRVDTSGPADIYVLPPHFHGDGKGGQSLVYNDFGYDIIDRLKKFGFVVSLRKSICSSSLASRVFTLVCMRPN